MYLGLTLGRTHYSQSHASVQCMDVTCRASILPRIGEGGMPGSQSRQKELNFGFYIYIYIKSASKIV